MSKELKVFSVDEVAKVRLLFDAGCGLLNGLTLAPLRIAQ